MKKQFFYDANKVKWVIEQANDSDDSFMGGDYIWIHPVDSNERYSGFVGETIQDAFFEFMEEGYLEDETENQNPSIIITGE